MVCQWTMANRPASECIIIPPALYSLIVNADKNKKYNIQLSTAVAVLFIRFQSTLTVSGIVLV